MESTKDQEPTPDTKEREGVRENNAVETTTSTPVDNDMESTTYQVPSSVETEPECLNEIKTVEPITSAPVQDEMESKNCLLYTSPSPRDQRGSRMPSSA